MTTQLQKLDRILQKLPIFFILTHPQVSQRECFDVYKVTSRNRSRSEVIVSNRIIPSVSGNGNLTLNVTTNTTLSTNMFYQATLFGTTDMMDAGSFQFCECILS